MTDLLLCWRKLFHTHTCPSTRTYTHSVYRCLMALTAGQSNIVCESKFPSTNYLKTKKRARAEQQTDAHRFNERSALYARTFHAGTRVSLMLTH